MDARLRKLERLAQNGDAKAALRLANEMKRLVNDNWQAVPCSNRSPHGNCSLCGGKEYVRVNITELNEHIPAHKRQDSSWMKAMTALQRDQLRAGQTVYTPDFPEGISIEEDDWDVPF